MAARKQKSGGAPKGAWRECPRKRALAVLLETEKGAFASERLRASDAPFVREVVLGVLRRRHTLDVVHAAFAKRGLDTLDPPVLVAVRLGLYQLLFLDAVPAHAAVSETVGALDLRSHRAYVNGILRAFLRDSHRVPVEQDRGGASPRKRLERPGRTVTFFSRPVFPDPEQDRNAWLSALHSFPEFLVARWVAEVGEEEAVARMTAANKPVPVSLRPRGGRVDARELASRLAADGAVGSLSEHEGIAHVLIEGGHASVFAGRPYKDGLFSVQQPEQGAAAAILAPKQGEVVWDSCAAPGGKATQLGEMLEGRGRVMATDASSERVQRLTQNVERLGLSGTVQVGVHDVLQGAAEADHDVAAALQGWRASGADPGRARVDGEPERGFDAILLDVPCSNTAVLGARPEARWRLRPETFEQLALLQRRMIVAVLKHLAAGGRLVYSTCSLEPEEGAAHGLQATRSSLVWTAT